MVKLFVEIEDALLSKALIDAQEQEVSLDTFISDAVNAALANPSPSLVRPPVNVEHLISSAVERACAKASGSEFMLFDLCAQEDWEGLSGGERKSLGKGFRKAVELMEPPVAVYLRRTSGNKAVYQRA